VSLPTCRYVSHVTDIKRLGWCNFCIKFSKAKGCPVTFLSGTGGNRGTALPIVDPELRGSGWSMPCPGPIPRKESRYPFSGACVGYMSGLDGLRINGLMRNALHDTH
jgi:hypothetical protein